MLTLLHIIIIIIVVVVVVIAVMNLVLLPLQSTFPRIVKDSISHPTTHKHTHTLTPT